MQHLTARVFDVTSTIVRELGKQSFPTLNGVPCEVHLGQPVTVPARFVSVVTRTETHNMEWRTPSTRTESFTVRIVVQSDAQHVDALTAWDDLRDITAVVERTFRGTDGLPTSFLRDAFGADVMVDVTAVSSIDPRAYPFESGWGGQALIDIPVTCRI